MHDDLCARCGQEVRTYGAVCFGCAKRLGNDVAVGVRIWNLTPLERIGGKFFPKWKCQCHCGESDCLGTVVVGKTRFAHRIARSCKTEADRESKDVA
jgi:hypothetical protein